MLTLTTLIILIVIAAFTLAFAITMLYRNCKYGPDYLFKKYQ